MTRRSAMSATASPPATRAPTPRARSTTWDPWLTRRVYACWGLYGHDKGFSDAGAAFSWRARDTKVPSEHRAPRATLWFQGAVDAARGPCSERQRPRGRRCARGPHSTSGENPAPRRRRTPASGLRSSRSSSAGPRPTMPNASHSRSCRRGGGNAERGAGPQRRRDP